jgi:hypothetical protein
VTPLGRRAVLGWIVSATVAAAARGHSRADEGHRPGDVVDREGGAPLPVVRRAVISISNANDRYLGWVQVPTAETAPWFLSLDGRLLPAGSWGNSGVVTFKLDRREADALAAIWNVPRQDRRPLDTGLVFQWRARQQPFRVGAPMEIVLRVENAGPKVIGFSIGGASRGITRSNRFAFRVEQQGRSLPLIVAHDFGGIFSYRALAPGDSVEVSDNLAEWTPLDTAGSYHVRCFYRAELALGRSGAGGAWPDHAHEAWELEIAGAVDIVVS